MTRNESHVHDISTLANFKDWAMSIGAALAAFGWVQTADTGQVNWGSLGAVPASGNYVYEVWKPGDAGTPFYVRIDYGNDSGKPALMIQAGTLSNGTGGLTGFTTAQISVVNGAGQGSQLFNCLYSGDGTSFAIMMWRDVTNGSNFIIAADRSRNMTGAATNSYFTLFVGKGQASNNGFWMQSVMYGVGAAQQCGTINGFWNCITGATDFSFGARNFNFNGNTGMTPVFPAIGYYDNPTLVVAHAGAQDWTELSIISTTLYGATHTFLYSENQCMSAGASMGTMIRWE